MRKDNDFITLGIETSCDDTSVAIIKNRREILSHVSFSQIDILKKFGGVVPEIAARNHVAKITPLLEEAFERASITPKDLNLIGVTTHPGLMGPLLTGLNAAKTLSLIFKTPVIPVNHLFAHLEAIHLTDDVEYPYIGVLVSGGHSIFFEVTSPYEFITLGSTIDDAAGEAFDKGGKLMGLAYPAGQQIDELAKAGDSRKFTFPIGIKGSKNCNLSYSGTKTSLRYLLEKEPHLIRENLNDLCASYQKAIVDALVLKLKYARRGRENYPIVVGGGVACNSALRNAFKEIKTLTYFVSPQYCMDNGAMIAHRAYQTETDAIPYPDSLKLDARNRFLNKELING